MTKRQAQRQDEPSDQDYELPTSMASAQLAADGNRSTSTECLPVEILVALESATSLSNVLPRFSGDEPDGRAQKPAFKPELQGGGGGF